AGVTKARDRAQKDDPRQRGRGCPDADHGQAAEEGRELRPPAPERRAIRAHDLVARENERRGGREERQEVARAIASGVGKPTLDRHDRLKRHRQAAQRLDHGACRRRRAARVEENPPFRRRDRGERRREEDRGDGDREHHRAEDDQRIALLHFWVVILRGGAAIAACAAMRLAIPTSTTANTVAPSMKKNASALSAVVVAITLFKVAVNSSPCVDSWWARNTREGSASAAATIHSQVVRRAPAT